MNSWRGCGRMWRNISRSAAVIVGAGVCVAAFAATAAVAAPPMHATKDARVVSTTRAKYSLFQGEQETGHEWVTRRVFDDNTIRFEAENLVRQAVVTMTSKTELVVEEESYFPRRYRAEKTITQPDEEIVHVLTAEMFANVAVLTSELRGTKDTRRVIVPAGTAIQEVGQLFTWYQLLFWIDPALAARQKIQWVDPSSGALAAGEIYIAGEETILVLGKKTKVTVYKAERERLGAATIYVDAKKRIVKLEQNMMIYRLDEWSEELAKK
jgi:hypothetical protein